MQNDEENPVAETIDEPNEISKISEDRNDGACLSLVASTEMDSFVVPTSANPYDFEYNMCHTHRGLALMFSHEHFDKLPSRPYTNIDSENLKCVLENLGFTVKVYKDLQRKEIEETIKEASTLNHSKSDCILIAVLTHGEESSLHARDEPYELDSIFRFLTPKKSPSLAAKPKLFIVQASRGKRRDSSVCMNAPQTIETDSQSKNNFTIPLFADFLVAFGTASNASSSCDAMQGSWFIYNLCEELEENSKNMNILHLLTFVSQRVANRESSHEKEVSCTWSTLTKVLRFGDKFD